MDGDWLRLGRAVRAARGSKGLSQVKLSELAGVGRTVIQTIERGGGFDRVTSTLRSLEVALDWKRGSIESILDGGDPLPLSEPGKQDSAGQFSQGAYASLPFRVTHTLLEGTTLDTRIVPLTPNADMVVVVMGKPRSTPEQLKTALLAWEEEQGHLARLDRLSEEPQAVSEQRRELGS
ncbi:Helix-turn-helix domain-containing protein [Streptomyces sp. DvalAA-14]|uniref:helix-turn-helix domain-containing protein n=1 Tax=unclassified Streptomyces TaxID=2593676 RepID=UPI00081B0DD5|nr:MULTISPECIES: helix-turn-helix domain-containing protein [unclassified Streptomyces]MYS21355.1 helix-turn-helix domain-containing protein [Streptomyces sp. SID4948]SCD90395.1 Helix-turn-helix domain-containing protein [Streptomyces sp. DvalAA-14]